MLQTDRQTNLTTIYRSTWLRMGTRDNITTDGVRSFGRQDVWATDVWETNFFPNVHLGDNKLDVWATKVNR